jgi:hypothetical protein
VCQTEASFRKIALDRFAGIPQGALDIIDAAQPYHSPKATRGAHWLNLLDRRWNRDKHRSPVVVGMLPLGTAFYFDERPTDTWIVTGTPIEEGMVVGGITLAAGQKTDFQAVFTFQVTLDEEGTTTLARTLPGVLQANYGLIRLSVFERLRPFFK